MFVRYYIHEINQDKVIAYAVNYLNEWPINQNTKGCGMFSRQALPDEAQIGDVWDLWSISPDGFLYPEASDREQGKLVRSSSPEDPRPLATEFPKPSWRQ